MQGPEFQFLKSTDLLSGLDNRLILFLASRLHKKKFRKGEHVFFSGRPGFPFLFCGNGPSNDDIVQGTDETRFPISILWKWAGWKFTKVMRTAEN
jgi:hypothetical protein